MFMGDSGSQMLGFALAALGLTSSWRVAGTTVATLILPVLVLAVPDPRHDARHGRAAARRPADLPGRPRPLLAPARALRALRAARGRAARADLALHRRLEPRLHVARQHALHDHRRRPDLRRCSSSSRASSPTSTAGRCQLGEPLGLAQAFAVHWRRLVEVLVDFLLITASFLAAYAIRFGWPGTDTQQIVRDLTLPIVLAARYLVFIPFGLYRPGLALRRGPRRGRDRGGGARLGVPRAQLHGLHPGPATTSTVRSSSSTR